MLHQVVGETLRRLGVTCLFGLVGRTNIALIHSVVQRGDIRYIGARHETSVVSMADAHARASGALAVCTVTLGPAVTNALTGVVEADRGGTPLLVLVGDLPERRRHAPGTLDPEALFAAVGVAVRRPARPETVAADLWEAARQAVAERRPVVVPIGADLLESPVDEEALSRLDALMPLPGRPELPPAPAAVAAAVDALAAADRPVGPPPLARGPPRVHRAGHLPRRTTPARAGTTPGWTGSAASAPDHPRSRGDHRSATVEPCCGSGPPPLARGPPFLTCGN